MAYRSIAFLLLLFSPSVFAFYGTLPDPVGFSRSVDNFFYARSQLDSITAGVIRQRSATFAVAGGRRIGFDVAYKIASGSTKFAGIVAAAIYHHPYTRTAVGVATLLSSANLVYDLASGWQKEDHDVVSQYGYTFGGWRGEPFPTAQAACHQIALSAAYSIQPAGKVEYAEVDSSDMCSYGYSADYPILGKPPGYVWGPSYKQLEKVNKGCPPGYTLTPAGCIGDVTRTTITEQEFIDRLRGRPIPSTVPSELPPGIKWPVGVPVINPSPSGEPMPRFVPIGDPKPNPKYDPNSPVTADNQPYLQPGVRIVPRSTEQEPFRVDYQPVDRPVGSDEPAPDSSDDTDSSSDKKSDSADPPSLCEQYPDILACQKVTEPEEVELPSQDFEFDLTPDTGYSGVATCPEPINVNVVGESFTLSWQGFCDSLSMIRPLVLSMAWLAAAFIVLGVRER